MLDARCSLPEFGAADETLSFQLSSEPFDDVASLISDQMAIDDTSWPDAPPDSVGQPYPMPYGTPGFMGTALGTNPAFRVWPVTSSYGEQYSILVVTSDVLTLSGASGSLFSGMVVTYADGLGGISGLTDGQDYYVQETGTNTYELYDDEDLQSRVTGLGAPSGGESLTINDYYAKKVLIAGDAVEATQVDLYPETELGASARFVYSVTEEADGYGRTVATVDLSSLGSGTTWPSTVRRRLMPLFCAFRADGVRSSVTVGSVNTLGQMLAHLAHQSSLPYDVPSFLQLAPLLPQPVGLPLMDDAVPSDLLYDLLRVLPVGLYTSPRGIAAVRLPTDSRRGGAVELVDGFNCFRAGMVGIVNEPEDATNAIRVRYARNDSRGLYGRIARRGLDPSAVESDVYLRSSAVAQDSTERLLVEKLDWDYQGQAARLVARWVSRQASVSPRTLQVDVPAALAQALLLGQAVSFTSADLHVNRALGFVQARTQTSAGLWVLRLYFLHGVASDIAETPGGASSTPPSNPSGRN